MTAQLTLELPQASTGAAARGSQHRMVVLSARQEMNAQAVRQGNEPYHPRRCAERIMANVREDEWTGFIDLCHLTKMHPWLIGRMFDLLVAWGKLERTELYYIIQTGMIAHDRTKHPGYKNYHGYEWGYRKVKHNNKAERQR